MPRTVADRLTVAADGADLRGIDVRLGQQLAHRLREPAPELHVGAPQTVDFVFPGHAERPHLGAQLVVKRERSRRNEFRLRRKADEDRINAIHARARERADKPFVADDVFHSDGEMAG